MNNQLAGLIFIRYFWLLTVLLVIVILLGGYILFIKPKLAPLQTGMILDAKIYGRILTQEKDYLNKIKTLEAAYKNLDQDKLKKLNYIIADRLDPAGLLYVFNALNSQAGLMPTNFTYTNEKGITRVKISFSTKDYSQFKNYLAILENSVRLMDITNLHLSVRQGEYSVDLNTYYLSNAN